MANNDIGYFRDGLPKELSLEETERYFQLARSGDSNAKIKLKEHNLRLVVYIINKNFQNVPNEHSSVDIEDLISIGTFGLMKAVETFDIEKGLKFATYATRCITNEILMVLRKLKKQKLEQSLDASLTEDKDGNNLTLEEIIDTGEDITEKYEQSETQTIIKNSLNLLNDLERQVVELYYGFNGERLTHRQIGEKLGYSQSYICRIDARAKQKLGKYLESQGQGYVKKGYAGMEHIKNMKPNERATYCANLIIDTGIQIDELARKIGVRKTSVRQWMSKILPGTNEELYERLIETLNQHEDEKNQKKKEEQEIKKQLKIQEKLEKQKLREQYQNAFDRRRTPVEEKPLKSEGEVKMERLLLGIFPNYTEDEIKQAINQLPNEEREILLLRYPLDAGKQHTLSTIAIQYNINPTSMQWKIKSIIGHTTKILENKKVNTTKKVTTNKQSNKSESIFDLYPDYTEEQVLTAINSLNETNKKIIELKYGLNGNPVTRTKEIAEQLGIKYKTLSVRIPNTRKAITKRLEKQTNLFSSPKKDKKGIYALFPNFTETTINELINSLEERRKTVLELKFGLNGNEQLGVREIARRIGCKQSEVNMKVDYIIKVMAKQLNDKTTVTSQETMEQGILTQQTTEMPKPEEIVQSLEQKECLPSAHQQIHSASTEETDITLITNRFQTPISLDFEKHREHIKMLISMLNNSNEQVILLLRLGYVRNQTFTEEQISKFLGIEETEVHDTIQRGLSNITGISAITMTGVESARQQLIITRETKQN